LQHCIRPPCGP
jgi:hypothetical protein